MSVTTLADFADFGLPEQTIWDGSWESVAKHVGAAESDILEALRSGGYDEPIPATSWTPSMKRRACVIAGYHMLRVRGWQAQSPEDAEFVEEYKRCLEWLKDVSKGMVKPLPVNTAGEALDADPTTDPEGAAVVTETSRGWGSTWP